LVVRFELCRAQASEATDQPFCRTQAPVSLLLRGAQRLHPGLEPRLLLKNKFYGLLDIHHLTPGHKLARRVFQSAGSHAQLQG